MNDRYRSPEKSTGENKGIFCAFLRDRGIEIGGIREMHHMTEADNPRFSRSARLVMFRETTLPKNEIHLDAETQYLVYCSGGRLYKNEG